MIECDRESEYDINSKLDSWQLPAVMSIKSHKCLHCKSGTTWDWAANAKNEFFLDQKAYESFYPNSLLDTEYRHNILALNGARKLKFAIKFLKI